MESKLFNIQSQNESGQYIVLTHHVLKNNISLDVASLLRPIDICCTRPLKFIEDYIRNYVYPFYANTHTTTSATSRQTTQFRQDAR